MPVYLSIPYKSDLLSRLTCSDIRAVLAAPEGGMAAPRPPQPALRLLRGPQSGHHGRTEEAGRLPRHGALRRPARQCEYLSGFIFSFIFGLF